MAPKRGVPRSSTSKYTHIHLFEHGRWGAWVREPRPKGKRRFLGTFLTEKLAARCQDRAKIKIQMEFGRKDVDTKLNFDRADYAGDEPLRTTMTTDEFLDHLRGESRGKYNRFQATPCLRKFMAEENLESDREPSKRTSETGPKSKKQKCSTSRKIVYSSSEEESYNSDEDEPDHDASEEYDFSKEEYNPSEEEEDNSCGSEDEDESEDEDSDPEDDDNSQETVESPPVSTPDPVALHALQQLVASRSRQRRVSGMWISHSLTSRSPRSLQMRTHEDDEDNEEDEEDDDEMEHGMNVVLFLATRNGHDERIKEFLKTKKN